MNIVFPMQTQLSQLLNRQTALLLISAWVLLSVSQTLHFYLYYEQTLFNSLYWSFRDWLVWFAIFAGLYIMIDRQRWLLERSVKSLMCVAILALAAGVVHILIVNSIGNVVGTATRPFWVDFGRLYSKRWLQYLFTFCIFWLLVKNHFSRLATAKRAQEKNKPDDTIQVSDGKQTHWLKFNDIQLVEAAGNYVCFHVGQQQVIVRATLKSIERKLPQGSFLRVSRSHIVNTESIERSTRVGRSKYQLHLESGMAIPVGRSHWSDVKQALSI